MWTRFLLVFSQQHTTHNITKHRHTEHRAQCMEYTVYTVISTNTKTHITYFSMFLFQCSCLWIVGLHFFVCNIFWYWGIRMRHPQFKSNGRRKRAKQNERNEINEEKEGSQNEERKKTVNENINEQ